MILETSLASPSLSPYIRKYWKSVSYSTEELEIKMFPKGLYFLIFIFKEKGNVFKEGKFIKKEYPAFISGQITNSNISFTTRGHSRIVGIELTPIGLYKLLGIPVHEFNNDIEDLYLIDSKIKHLHDELAETEDFNAIVQLLETYFSYEYYKSKIEISPYVESAYEIIKNNLSQNVEEIAKKSFISKRQLHRGFVNQIGLNPKSLINLQKAHFVLKEILSGGEANLEELSLKWGYYDSSHLSNSFKKYFNSSPLKLDKNELLGLEKFHGWKEFISFIK